MEVVVTTGAISRAKLLQSNHHHHQTNIQFLTFYTGRMPFLSPNQQCQSTEGKNHSYYGTSTRSHRWCIKQCHFQSSVTFNHSFKVTVFLECEYLKMVRLMDKVTIGQ